MHFHGKLQDLYDHFNAQLSQNKHLGHEPRPALKNQVTLTASQPLNIHEMNKLNS